MADAVGADAGWARGSLCQNCRKRQQGHGGHTEPGADLAQPQAFDLKHGHWGLVVMGDSDQGRCLCEPLAHAAQRPDCASRDQAVDISSFQ